MTDKNEVMELAKKCGAVQVYPGEDVAYTFSFAQLISFAAALEEKPQAKITRLERALTRLMSSDSGIAAASDDDLSAAVADINADSIVREQAASVLQAREALSATQQSSEAFLAEVRAKAKLEGKIEALTDAADYFQYQRTDSCPGIRIDVALIHMAAELRNSAAQPQGKEVKCA